MIFRRHAKTYLYGRGIWQKRYCQHRIRDERDDRVHGDFVHLKPVKQGLAAHPADWPHSTARKSVALGLYDPAWALPDHTILPSGMGEGA